MKVAIFYLSWAPGVDRHQVHVSEDPHRDAWIRAEVVEAADDYAAIDMARPQRDERVLNTRELPEAE